MFFRTLWRRYYKIPGFQMLTEVIIVKLINKTLPDDSAVCVKFGWVLYKDGRDVPGFKEGWMKTRVKARIMPIFPVF